MNNIEDKCIDKYDYINSFNIDEYKTDELEKAWTIHKEMFKLTPNQYKHYIKFSKNHKDCKVDKETGRHKFGTIGGGLSIIYKTNNEWYITDKFIRCHACNIEEKLEDTDIDIDMSDEKFQKHYEQYCKYGPSLSKVEFYRFNEIWEEYVEEKGEQLEIGFMGTGLGYLINVKTKEFIYSITDTSNW